MSMSTYVQGIIENDEKHKKMIGVAKMCKEAEVKLPVEVDKYFGNVSIDTILNDYIDGMVTNLPKDCESDYHNDCSEGIEIDLTKIPKHIEKIRFINSW